ncbi:indolepyruvate oxidoreductase subunit beta family protein [Neopusillimonas aromaticivorans]|uniref:indolepyruvate oxidoreductase subunit beta family protein n=1 Tax=Neopusillimonas aromaticivorans TaxID=2979868 RepID=UPI00259963F2|nr:indolepyruvate oxidoreductase subunit beta family protein [Neopusillimonas aromaticivorans]WJJ94619.1 indolepyruvate oxidoreductase subunit beta family protein [Neopusillimonas aromaticivorans]
MRSDQQPVPIKIAILAMGGEGGGVLADWVVSTAEKAGFYAQTTSVPGVAQRTGATIYYVEILPVQRSTGQQPVLGLMPVPGDVDVVLASELMESARAVQRGLVTPDKTLLITSSNRVYAMPEKMAMGDGRQDSEALLTTGRQAARQYVCHDFAALAAKHGSVISASLFGVLAASGVLPLPREAFEATIRQSGVGVNASLAAFEAGYGAWSAPASEASAALASGVAPASPSAAPDQGQQQHRVQAALDPRLAGLEAQMSQAFPSDVHAVVSAGIARTADYQDPAYARQYLAFLQPVVVLDTDPGRKYRLLETVARHLALWMTYEDTVRVAELKIRRTRFDRVRAEHGVQSAQLVQVNEFFHPRLEEIADTLPTGMANRLLRTGWMRGLVQRHTRKGRVIHSNRLGGFLMLYLVASLRGIRRRSLRYAREHAEMARWLEQIIRLAPDHYDLACEVAACQNLVKGYGDTHARGLRSFQMLMGALPHLERHDSPALQLAGLRQAALADDKGNTLETQLAAMNVPGFLRP